MYRNSKMWWLLTTLKWRYETEIWTLSVGLLQATQYLFGKSDEHDQWNVLNLLKYTFGIKDNFEQGGIVPLKELSLFKTVFYTELYVKRFSTFHWLCWWFKKSIA